MEDNFKWTEALVKKFYTYCYNNVFKQPTYPEEMIEKFKATHSGGTEQQEKGNDSFQWTDATVQECIKYCVRISPTLEDISRWAHIQQFKRDKYFEQSHTPKQQEYNKPDWEIISGCAKGGGEHTWHNDNSHGGESCWQQGCEIRSVKKRDGEIVCVGDEDVSFGKIIGFKVMNDGMMRVEFNDCYKWLHIVRTKLPPQPQKLIETEDGIAMAGQQGFVLSTDTWSYSPCKLPADPFKGDHNQFKYFHSGEAAEKYIADNKPQPQKEELFSLKHLHNPRINEKSKPEEKRVEVEAIQELGRYHTLTDGENWYQFWASESINKEKYLTIKKAIEQVLNDDDGCPHSRRQAVKAAELELLYAVGRLIEELEKDKTEGSYYYVWQANIAIAFQDECRKHFPSSEMRELIHEISNNATKNFLNMLCIKPQPSQVPEDYKNQNK